MLAPPHPHPQGRFVRLVRFGLIGLIGQAMIAPADYAQLWRECETRAQRRDRRAQRREARQNLAAAFAELERLRKIVQAMNARAHCRPQQNARPRA